MRQGRGLKSAEMMKKIAILRALLLLLRLIYYKTCANICKTKRERMSLGYQVSKELFDRQFIVANLLKK